MLVGKEAHVNVALVSEKLPEAEVDAILENKAGGRGKGGGGEGGDEEAFLQKRKKKKKKVRAQVMVSEGVWKDIDGGSSDSGSGSDSDSGGSHASNVSNARGEDSDDDNLDHDHMLTVCRALHISAPVIHQVRVRALGGGSVWHYGISWVTF